MMRAEMTFDDWMSEGPDEIKLDSAWKIEAYRLALFLADLSWKDFDLVAKHPKAREHSDQLLRAASKISANVIEGYSRDTGKARSTFYEYAVGSARETRDWYFKVRHAMRSTVVEHRIDLCTQIVKLCLTMCANERQKNRRASGD
jgi:four helix bundle protein